MRKSRGGLSFQRIVKHLLNKIGVPCEEPAKETRSILRKVDLVSPDAKTAKDTPDKAIFIAAKRTFRERWKEVVPEHMKGARIYVVSINSQCPESKADEMREVGIIAYVKDELKDQKHLKNKPWIRKLTDLPRDVRSSISRKVED
jgi:hypothetical protein